VDFLAEYGWGWIFSLNTAGVRELAVKFASVYGNGDRGGDWSSDGAACDEGGGFACGFSGKLMEGGEPYQDDGKDADGKGVTGDSFTQRKKSGQNLVPNVGKPHESGGSAYKPDGSSGTSSFEGLSEALRGSAFWEDYLFL